MRVLLATCMEIPHTGGASTHFELLTRSLENAGMFAGRVIGQDGAPHKVSKAICALRVFGHDARRAESLRMTAVRLGRAIDRHLAEGPADIVHCHDALSAYAAVYSRSVHENAVTVVQTVHGPWSREALSEGINAGSRYIREIRRLEESAYAGCARLIAVDQGQAEILHQDFGIPEARISVIQNATDCAAIVALSRGENLHRVPSPYFVVPRRLVPKNGVGFAIEAFRLLPLRNVHLAIAGDGPLAGDLGRQAEQAGIQDRVHFLGSIPHTELLPLVAHSAGVIVPSVPFAGVVEATSLSVIESFACGTPVIASNIGGLTELIRDGFNGLLFQAGDAGDLAGKVSYLVRMREEDRNRLCAEAAEAARSRWDVSSWMGRVREAYDAARDTRLVSVGGRV